MNPQDANPADDRDDNEIDVDLTEQERAAIDDEAGNDEGAATDAAKATAADDDLADDDDPASDSAAKEDDSALLRDALRGTTAALDALNKANGATPTPAEQEPEGPRDFDADLSALKTNRTTQLADLKKQYDDGDIDDDEYEAKRGEVDDAYMDARDEIRDARTVATVQAQTAAQHQANRQQHFEKAYSAFVGSAENAAMRSEALKTAFDASVVRIINADPSKSFEDALLEARNGIYREMGMDPPAVGSKPEKDRQIAKAIQQREGDRGGATLRDMPNAGADINSGDEALDNLSIEDLESALERAPADKVEQYLASAPGAKLTGREA